MKAEAVQGIANASQTVDVHAGELDKEVSAVEADLNAAGRKAS
ncbi:hypothetical protein [Telmatospirillum siberiense]|nr:hypothetical protein [Telmatospirillum siberiense]